MRIDLDDDRLPATRRAVRWLLVVAGVAGAIDGIGPLVDAAGELAGPEVATAFDQRVAEVVGRTLTDLTLTSVALSVPWWVTAALLPHRPRLATAMATAMALVTVPRQLWLGGLQIRDLQAADAPLFPDVVPRLTVIVLVGVTLWLAYLSRPRGHWREPASWLTRRALVPTLMALLWTVGPIADPVPATGASANGLLPLYLAERWDDPLPWVYLMLHALPVLVFGVLGVTRHRRVTGAGMLLYGTVMFLLTLAEHLRGRGLWDSSLLPLGGITFLGLVSLIVIGHQWSTEGARFIDPGTPPPHLLEEGEPDGSVR